jgi:hypothetical protein
MRTHALAALLVFAAASAHAADLAPAPDYAQPYTWVCRPGAEERCVKDLSALEVNAKGERKPLPAFRVDETAPIDCFYVYPTVSKEPHPIADLKIDADIIRAAHGQAGRFASTCRLFAPVYRQATLAAIFAKNPKDKPDWNIPYEDVKAAWRSYLAHDNHGRGVVLIGHSQGSIILTKLLASEIDGKPDQALLVSALLGGDPVFGVPKGKDVGGTLKAIPLCRARGQVGCVMVWDTFKADDASEHLFFGRSPPGMAGACTNPAALSGGRVLLKAYFRKLPQAPAEDPPYIESVGQYWGECVTDAGGATFRVSVEPTAVYAPLLKSLLDKTETLPGWGLHILDFSLAQGDLIDDVAAQSETWVKTHGPK